ncbi:MAG TPA: aldehyde dehydrogenase [Propylenella sp.]|nr:aldehyde dehydrogenase [Propylenella sp.]
MILRATLPSLNFNIRHPGRLFIDGGWQPASGRREHEIISPANANRLGAVPLADRDDVDAAVSAARKAFDHGPWPHMSGGERAALLRRVAELLRERLEETATALTMEMGAPFSRAKKSATRAAQLFDQYAEVAATYPIEETRRREDGGNAVVVGEPVGVVAAIIPWNAPALVAALKVAPALAAGCTVILKPPPETALDSYILAECIEEAGLPSGVFNLLIADAQHSDLLVRHPGVDKISFTGSTGVGRHILSVASERVARVALELGGKSPAIVLDDADPALVAEQMTEEVIGNSGQVCAALTRLIVPRGQESDYADRLADRLAHVKVGDPFDPETKMGPLAMSRHLDLVMTNIQRGVDEGAKLRYGGDRPADAGDGFYLKPAVFENVEPGMTIAREEVFGPVLAILGHDGPDSAVEIANDSVYGLHGCVFTADRSVAYQLARRMRTGSVGHNRRMIDWGMPFGGFKQSGLGREGGVEGFEQFLEPKTIYVESAPVSAPPEEHIDP